MTISVNQSFAAVEAYFYSLLVPWLSAGAPSITRGSEVPEAPPAEVDSIVAVLRAFLIAASKQAERTGCFLENFGFCYWCSRMKRCFRLSCSRSHFLHSVSVNSPNFVTGATGQT